MKGSQKEVVPALDMLCLHENTEACLHHRRRYRHASLWCRNTYPFCDAAAAPVGTAAGDRYWPENLSLETAVCYHSLLGRCDYLHRQSRAPQEALDTRVARSVARHRAYQRTAHHGKFHTRNCRPLSHQNYFLAAVLVDARILGAPGIPAEVPAQLFQESQALNRGTNVVCAVRREGQLNRAQYFYSPIYFYRHN